MIKMLFSEEIEGLCDDEFEGSNDEHCIFMGVFHGNDTGSLNKRCLVTGIINFESEKRKHTDSLFYTNSENSALTNQCCTVSSCVEDYCITSKDFDHVKENSGRVSSGTTGLGCHQESSTFLVERDGPDSRTKRMKCSVDEPSNSGNKNSTICLPGFGKDMVLPRSTKEIIPDILSVASFAGQTLTCRLVESSSQGVISSCYVLKRYGEMDTGGNVNDCDASKLKTSRLFGKDSKDSVVIKDITSPASQESFTPELVVEDPSIAATDRSGPFILATERSTESVNVISNACNMASKSDSLKDPRPHLRYHINHLLVAAGWCLVRRKRDSRTYFETVYKSPGGKIIREFPTVWRLCGQSLFAGRCNLTVESNREQWADIVEFLSDLTNTLIQIEQQMHDLQNHKVQAQTWSLLDPFVVVVFVNKNIGALRKGRSVKAVRSVLTDSNMNKDNIKTRKNGIGVRNKLASRKVLALESGSTSIQMDAKFCGPSPATESTLTAVKVCGKGGLSISGELKQGGGVKTLKGWITNHSLDNQSDSCLYDVPIACGGVDDLFGKLKVVFCRQDINASYRHFGESDSDLKKENYLQLVQGGSNYHSKPVYESQNTDRVCNQLEGSAGNQIDCLTEILTPSKFSDNIFPVLETCENGASRDAGFVESMSEGLEIAGVFDNMQQNMLTEQPVNTLTLLHDANRNLVGLSLSHPEGAVANAEQLNALDVKTAQSMCMEGAVDFRKQVQLMSLNEDKEIQEMDMPEGELKEETRKTLSPSRYDVEMLIENQSHERSIIELQGPSILPQGMISHGMTENCRAKGLAHGSILDPAVEATMHHEWNYPLGVVSPMQELPCHEQPSLPETKMASGDFQDGGFAHDSRLGTVIDISVHHEVRSSVSPRSPVGADCSVDGENQMKDNSDFSSCHEQKSVPKMKMTSEDFQEEGLTHDGRLCTVTEVDMHHEIKSSMRPRSPVGEDSPFDIENRMKDNIDFSLCHQSPSLPEIGAASEVSCLSGDSGHLERESAKVIDSLKLEMNHGSIASEVVLTKRMPKKSKKISEVKLTKLYKKYNRIGLSMPSKVQKLDFQGDRICLSSRRGQICHRGKLKNQRTHKKSSSVNSNPLESGKKSKFKKCNGSEDLCLVNHEGEGPKKLNNDKVTDEVLLQARNRSLHSQTCKNIKSENPGFFNEHGRKRFARCQIDDDDLLIAAIIKPKEFSSVSKLTTSKSKACSSKAVRRLKSRKGICKLLPRSPVKGGKHYMDGKCISSGTRTVLSWLIDSGVVSVNDVIQYRSSTDDTVVKDCWVTRDGIICKCCNKVLTLSEFKFHAGFKLYRPCLNLFLQSGKPFTLCQLQAWSAEYKARKGGIQATHVDEVDQNDDTCGLCGDGGELICCDNCPSTFHQMCLSTQDLPEGNWYCPSCICQICGNVVNLEASSSLIILKCLQCEKKYHTTCVEVMGINKGEAVTGTWFCGASCQEVHSGLRSRVGVMNHIADGFSWTLLRCIHGDQKVQSVKRFALMADCNSKLAVALTIMEECFLPMVDPRTGIDIIPHVLYSWGSNFARLNYQSFYTVILEKGDELISVASIRVHGVTVAEMPLIATCSSQRRQGMGRRLMNAIEGMLRSFKVEKLVIAAIPNLVDTWTSGFGFKPLEDEEKRQLSSINLMVFPGTILLSKCLYREEPPEIKREESIETGISCEERTLFETPQSSNVSFCAEVTTEPAIAHLNCKNLLVDDERGNCSHNTEACGSASFKTEHEMVSYVECCSLRKETVGMYDGS